jgi:hypothetical protein
MDTTIRFALRGLFVVLASTQFSHVANAAIVNLTTAGSSGVINGAIFEQINPHSTGTGLIDPFVQQSPQGNGTTSHAYNTTDFPVLDNKNSNNFNHSITLAETALLFRAGVPYRRFMLDINENTGNGNEFLSLDEVQIFAGGTANSSVTTFTGGILDHDGTLVYRLDAGGDNWVALDYSLNSGSGSGDMFMLVPNSVFAAFPNTAVITLYSQFGLQGVDPAGFTGNFGSSDGFEEWAAPVPEPATLVLAIGAVLANGLWRRRR